MRDETRPIDSLSPCLHPVLAWLGCTLRCTLTVPLGKTAPLAPLKNYNYSASLYSLEPSNYPTLKAVKSDDKIIIL